MSYTEIVDKVIEETIEPQALRTDTDGRFPRLAIDDLGRAGLLGLVSAERVGGQGAGLGAAADVIERIAQACPSTAMVVCMHYCAVAVIEAFGTDGLRGDIAAG